ncbi:MULTISPECIES: hypothetical protein [unclassified Streptomyces]|uniref:hypothetical protein n=1 Tax=unclassified Streptomyces TaxID=2593676 RepID=UPI002E14CCB4|nr:hypothetical protein OG452_22925 [Streptomyces sp. NBC_01197]WSS49362.1 hypothetical protein OG708_12370 [Streptomyces sp. NBC_01180]
MIRRLTQALAWSLATGAATTLTWWGVHSVMAGTAYDLPRALPVAGSPELLSSATQRPEEADSASPGAGQPPEGGSSSPAHSSRSASPPSSVPSHSAPGPASPPSSGSSGTSGTSGSSGDVRSYTSSGGRVVFELGATSAGLVSATPADGYQMQVWKQPEWIRVTFTQGQRSVSVFCTWNGHKPSVQVDDS